MQKPLSKLNISWLITYLTQRGISTSAILAGGGLPDDTNLTNLKTLPLANYLKLFNWAAEYLDDENLGLNLVDIIEPGDLLPVGLGAFNFTTLRELLQALDQFHSVITKGVNITYEESEMTSSFIYNVIFPSGEETRQDTELTLAMLMRTLRGTLGENWYPLQVDFSHPPPTDTRRHHEIFGEEVFFNKTRNCVILDADYLDTPMPDADPVLRKRFRNKLQNLLEEALREDDILSKVRYYITISFGSPHCGADFVAESMHKSRRSLTRHLKDLGTSFRQIKEDIKLEFAKTALIESRSNINAIALELGFSDVSAFARSFKSSTGLTPTQYREQTHKSPTR